MFPLYQHAELYASRVPELQPLANDYYQAQRFFSGLDERWREEGLLRIGGIMLPATRGPHICVSYFMPRFNGGMCLGVSLERDTMPSLINTLIAARIIAQNNIEDAVSRIIRHAPWLKRCEAKDGDGIVIAPGFDPFDGGGVGMAEDWPDRVRRLDREWEERVRNGDI